MRAAEERRRSRWPFAVVAAAGALGSFQLWAVAVSWGDVAANAWYPRSFSLGTLAVASVYVATGTLLVRRRPGNAIGGLLAAAGAGIIVYQACSEYAARGLLIEPGSLPGAGAAAVLSQTLWVVPYATLPVLLLVYPTGYLLTRRWRWAPIVASTAAVVMVVPGSAVLWRLRDEGAALLTIEDRILDPIGDRLAWLAVVLLVVALAGAAASLVVRWRRASAIERLQLKWLVLAGALLAVQGATVFLLPGGGGWVELLQLVSLISVPIAVAIAVTRYRLYEVDRIISRTVTYALLTGALGLVYAGGVIGFGGVTRLLGLQGDSDLVVAGSTLVAASLFLPARRRIQATVDRRFDRQRVDAAAVVDAFSSQLRFSVELEPLHAELRRVVSETLQPASVTVWFPGADR